jgi:hypothetical protein
MATFLHNVCEKQGLSIRWETSHAVIERVEIYAKKLDFDYGLTEDMLRSSMRKYEADDLTQESLATFLQSEIAKLRCLDDRTVGYIADKLQIEGLSRYDPKPGLREAVLLASSAMNRAAGWIYRDGYVEDPERIWLSLKQHATIEEGIDAIGKQETGLYKTKPKKRKR